LPKFESRYAALSLLIVIYFNATSSNPVTYLLQ
jgi:hypothetical protein